MTLTKNQAMEKKYIIGGLLVAAVGGYYLYNKNQKKKEAKLAAEQQQQAMAAAERAKAQAEADALAAKTEQEQRKVYADSAMKFADLWASGNYVSFLSADGDVQAAVIQLSDQEKAIQSKQNKLQSDKLKNTIAADILSTDELKKLHDAYLVTQNKYVGTKTYDSVNDDAHKVLLKYHIVEEYKQPISIASPLQYKLSSAFNFSGWVR